MRAAVGFEEELAFIDTSTVTVSKENVFEAGPVVTGYVNMLRIEHWDIEQLKKSVEPYYNFKTERGLPSRRSSHCLDFFLLFYEEHHR